MSARAHRLCRCGSPLAPGSAERCAPCEEAWQVWASVDVWGDRVVCPTCERPADDDLYPTEDGELRCGQCLEDERWVVRSGGQE